MTTNDYLRSLCYLLNLPTPRVVDLVEQAGYLVTPEEVRSYLAPDDSPDHAPCPQEVVGYFLNAMVTLKRGKDDSRKSPPVELPVSNNSVLKKLRIAFELKDTDIAALIESASTVKVTKSELSAFFRARDHRNYRECGDQFLRYLLKALAK